MAVPISTDKGENAVLGTITDCPAVDSTSEAYAEELSVTPATQIKYAKEVNFMSLKIALCLTSAMTEPLSTPILKMMC